jgi:hypothetical protein
VVFLSLPYGTPYALKPGNTWYQVLGQSSKVENNGQGTWHFVMAIP